MPKLRVTLEFDLSEDEPEADQMNVLYLLQDLLVCETSMRLVHHIAVQKDSTDPVLVAARRIYEQQRQIVHATWDRKEVDLVR
jgi:hypothetical protein